MFHYPQTVGQKSVGDPKIKMSCILSHVGDRQFADLICGKSLVPRKAKMLRGNLAGSIDEPPRWIHQNGTKSGASCFGQNIIASSLNIHGIAVPGGNS